MFQIQWHRPRPIFTGPLGAVQDLSVGGGDDLKGVPFFQTFSKGGFKIFNIFKGGCYDFTPS